MTGPRWMQMQPQIPGQCFQLLTGKRLQLVQIKRAPGVAVAGRSPVPPPLEAMMLIPRRGRRSAAAVSDCDVEASNFSSIGFSRARPGGALAR